MATSLSAEPLPKNFLNAIHQVETGGRLGPIKGDNGATLAAFQIHKSYWQDSRVAGEYSQCADYDYSVKVVNAYMNRYGANFIKLKNFEALARIHNGGPLGYKKNATKKYWLKVEQVLTKN